MAEDAPRQADGCRRCRGGKEYFRYWGDLYRFDVDQAKRLVQDGREPVEVEEDSVRASVDECSLHPEHLPHVDLSHPGLIAHIWYTDVEGTVHQGHVLIDGHHRAARCLAECRPFLAYLLSEEESRAVLLKGPATTAPEPAAVAAAGLGATA